jgi:hypothetical protein
MPYVKGFGDVGARVFDNKLLFLGSHLKRRSARQNPSEHFFGKSLSLYKKVEIGADYL